MSRHTSYQFSRLQTHETVMASLRLQYSGSLSSSYLRRSFSRLKDVSQERTPSSVLERLLSSATGCVERPNAYDRHK